MSRSRAELIASLPPARVAAILRALTPREASQLLYQWRGFWARSEQLRPGTPEADLKRTDWSTWLILAGRGWGKTKTLAEDVHEAVQNGVGRIAVVAPTAADVRDVIFDGPSGILHCGDPNNKPKFQPSRRMITWPNGAVAIGYSAEEPERLRGPQHDGAICDEIAAWKYPDACWSNLTFGVRLGVAPRIVAATTPKPTKFLKKLLADPSTVVTKGTSYDNKANLSPEFWKNIAKYEGTRIGRQELLAELLDDVPGALWSRALIESMRVEPNKVPPLVRVVVGLDPAVTAGEDSDETGMLVVGLGADGVCYVLEDHSARYDALEWGRKAAWAWAKNRGDRIVAEVNQGGDLVAANIYAVHRAIPVRKVHATRGKYTRAEPVAMLAERGQLKLVGTFPQLEDAMCEWQPGDEKSPDRLDAMVWAVWDLAIDPAPHHGIVEFEEDVSISKY